MWKFQERPLPFLYQDSIVSQWNAKKAFLIDACFWTLANENEERMKSENGSGVILGICYKKPAGHCVRPCLSGVSRFSEDDYSAIKF
jgi:hypothetical protein